MEAIKKEDQSNYRLREISKIKDYFNEEIQYQQSLTLFLLGEAHSVPSLRFFCIEISGNAYFNSKLRHFSLNFILHKKKTVF